MKKNLLYTFLLAALATSCTDEGFKKQGGSSEQASGNGSKVYIQNFLQEPDSVDVQALATRGVVETNPDANGICQAEWFTTQDEDEEIDIYELGDDDKFTYFATAKLHKDSKIEDHYWEGYNSWFGETMDFIDYKAGHKYIAVCGTKAINNYSRDTFNPYNPILNFSGQKSFPEDNESVNLDYDFMVSNLILAEVDEKGIKSKQPDFHFNHVGALVKYNLYNLPTGKKITKIIISSPNSNFIASDGSAIPLGFHVTAPFPLVWDTDNPNGNNCSPDYSNQMKYYTSATAPLEVTICDEDETIGRTPESVSSSDKYADYQTKLTASFFTTEALFSDGLTRRTDALVIRAIANDGSSYVCVTSEDADAYISGRTYIRNVVMKPDNVTLSQTNGYVDLGLPSGTLWAATNYGATSPEGTGRFFAWGETSQKTNFSWSNYKYGTSDNITKYTDSDKKLILDSNDDVCSSLNSKLSLPTQEQIRELVFKCRWECVYYNGTIGSLVTGPNGNQIFIPYTGYKFEDKTLYQSAHAYLWSKSFRGFDTSNDNLAGVLHAFGDGKRNNYSMQKCIGLPVRCVLNGYLTPNNNGKEYVDLGLPSHIYWAKRNVGASKPESVGSKFQWAGTVDVSNRTDLGWKNCPYQTVNTTSANSTAFSKYDPASNRSMNLELMDDAANVKWGGDWRMPSISEVQELWNYCYREETQNYNDTGVSGIIVYKAKNASDMGKLNLALSSYSLSDTHVFFPSKNEYRNDYWSRTIRHDSNFSSNIRAQGYVLKYPSHLLYEERYKGHYVRAVIQ